jgi:hypothetical protein
MTHQTALSLTGFYGFVFLLSLAGLITGYFPSRFGPPLRGALARWATIMMWGFVVLGTVALAAPDQTALAIVLLVIWLALFYGIGYRVRHARARATFQRLSLDREDRKGKRKRGG